MKIILLLISRIYYPTSISSSEYFQKAFFLYEKNNYLYVVMLKRENDSSERCIYHIGIQGN
jgi:hypothetical protein